VQPSCVREALMSVAVLVGAVAFQIVLSESYKLIFDRVRALPSSVKHVVVLLTVPIIYPKVSHALMALPQARNSVRKCGGSAAFENAPAQLSSVLLEPLGHCLAW
jgi:ABC-type uncharacterized transport system YnjBCD ATPase subunit